MNWKTKTLLIGTTVGAVTGLVAALIIMQRAEKSETTPKLTAGDGVKVGMGVLGVLKLLADVGIR
jgi:gas vesicle protein